MKDFKFIPNYENKYSINKNGDIYSHISKKILSPGINRGGYKTVCIGLKGRRISKTVHRLVMITFSEIDPKRPVINHINGVKTDNRLENLEWCTVAENNKHAYETGLKRKRWDGNNPNAITVLQYSISGKLIQKFNSMAEAARVLKGSKSKISEACKLNKIYKNFIWKKQTAKI